MSHMAMIFIAAGTGFWAIAFADTFVSENFNIHLERNFYDNFGVVGILLIVIGLSMLIYAFGAKFLGYMWQGCYGLCRCFGSRLYGSSSPKFILRPATQSELKMIYDMGNNLFDGGISPLDQMQRWQKKNGEVFWVLRKYGDKKFAPIYGYCCLIPLLESAVEELKSGEITGQSMRSAHISKNKRPKSVYLGAVAAIGMRAKGAMLDKLTHEIDSRRRGGQTKCIYTRPVTDDGLRLIKKYGFECYDCPKPTKDKLHYLDLALHA
ncbi:MAG: hypothetical protein R3E13_07520 [Alphaproteobacteria bacterium]